ncbi:hypothetical protein [Deinococcus aerolatus]|uniref:hypothetical protein n=1 Tax=Deinococcus aerolatus TaxID=522487 RepID=UPI001662FEFE|nr:hypothetical protein [Deinococcus aerolatus]
MRTAGFGDVTLQNTAISRFSQGIDRNSAFPPSETAKNKFVGHPAMAEKTDFNDRTLSRKK